MEWSRSVDGYCERLDAAYWSEPINALSNAAFLVAAVFMWTRCRGMPMARALCVVLGAIGIGSYAFHTHATLWAMLADVAPIGVFILLYIHAANRHFWGLSPLPALAATALFLPYAALLAPVFQRLPFFEISAAYWPVPLLIALYAVALRRRVPRVARRLAIGAGLLTASLVFRSLDMIVCPSFPLGTHFLWHLFNGAMLGWMIEVLRRHLAPERAGDTHVARLS